MQKIKAPSLRERLARSPDTMDELLKQQIALLIFIDLQRELASDTDKRFWQQAETIITSSVDLGVALDMLNSAIANVCASERREVFNQVASQVRAALLQDNGVEVFDVC